MAYLIASGWLRIIPVSNGTDAKLLYSLINQIWDLELCHGRYTVSIDCGRFFLGGR